MDRMRLSVAAVLLLAGLAGVPAPSAAVSDDALLAFISAGAHTGFGDAPEPGTLRAQVEPTDDAPDGPIHGRVEFMVEDLDGVHGPQRVNASFAIDVGTVGPGGGEWWDVEAPWSPPAGLYNITATLWADGKPSPWDTRWAWHAAGRSPTLGTGWGHVHFPAAAEFDLDGDGEPDVWLKDNATGAPLARSLDAYESVLMGTGLERWSRQCGRGLSLQLGWESSNVTDIRIAGSMVETLVPGTTPLELGTQSQGHWPAVLADGFYERSLGFHFYGSRSDYVAFSRTCAPPPSLPHTWSDGYRTVANVTHWDLDEDGQMDVLFWRTTATTVDEARNQTLEQRRTEETVLVSSIRAERRETVRRATFEMRPLGDGHEGAWVEIQDADRLFRTLLEPPENSTVSYRLSLPGNESFVEQDGTTTWAWIGHFSTQSLTVEYQGAGSDTDGSRSQTVTRTPPAGEDERSETSRPEPKRSPIPGPGIASALATLALVLVLALRRR